MLGVRPRNGSRIGHLPALDGVRGLAVAAVLLFHGGFPGAGGGFLGVDVFFVLSGFLITTLLLEEHRQDGRIDLGGFWARRARRLLPALVLVVGAVIVVGHLTGAYGPSRGLRGDALAALGYVANLHFIADAASYFGSTAAPSPLLHTWSLAVEEHFYLVWPPVVAGLLARRRSAAAVLGVAIVGAVASAWAMAALHHPLDDPTRAYLGTDTHAQSLLIGAALAAALALRPGVLSTRSREVVDAVGGAAAVTTVVLWSAARGDSAWLYGGGFAAVGCSTALVLAAVVLVPGGAVARPLAWPPLQALGRASYGVYLWHWPVFLFLSGGRTGLRGIPLLVVRLAATLALAAASLRLVELPVRRVRRPQRRVVVPLAGAMAVLAVAVALAPTGQETDPAAAAGSVTVPTPPPRPSPVPPTTAATTPTPTGPVRVLVLGDSVAMTITQYLPATTPYGVELENAAVLGCGVVRGSPYRYFGAERAQEPSCASWPDTWRARVEASRPEVVAVLVGRWEVMDRVVDGGWHRLGDPELDRALTAELERAVRVTTATGAHVAFLTAPYYRRGERPDGGAWPEDDPARVDHFNELLTAVARRHADRVTVVPLGEHLTPGGRYSATVDGVRVRYDGVHVGPAGSRWLAPWLLPQLRTAARRPPA